MKKWSLILFIAIFAMMFAVACGDDDTTDGDVTDGDTTDGDTTDGDATDGDATDGDVEDGDVEDGDVEDGDVTDGDAAGMVGGACAANDECLTAFCLSSTVIQTLTGNAELEIPNGYCSTLNPDDCTEDVGGLPISAAFLGEGYEDFNICLAPCAEDADCRPEDEGVCFDPMFLVSEGYMTEEAVTAIFGDNKVCMPQGLLDAAIATLAGDGE